MSTQNIGSSAVAQELFNALADPTRRTIVELLAKNGRMSATDIYHNFTVSYPAVSQHLRVLREADLVHLKKDAQRHIYSLNGDSLRRLESWAKHTTELWDKRFDKLDKLLEPEKRKPKKRR